MLLCAPLALCGDAEHRTGDIPPLLLCVLLHPGLTGHTGQGGWRGWELVVATPRGQGILGIQGALPWCPGPWVFWGIHGTLSTKGTQNKQCGGQHSNFNLRANPPPLTWVPWGIQGAQGNQVIQGEGAVWLRRVSRTKSVGRRSSNFNLKKTLLTCFG